MKKLMGPDLYQYLQYDMGTWSSILYSLLTSRSQRHFLPEPVPGLDEDEEAAMEPSDFSCFIPTAFSISSVGKKKSKLSLSTKNLSVLRHQLGLNLSL